MRRGALAVMVLLLVAGGAAAGFLLLRSATPHAPGAAPRPVVTAPRATVPTTTATPRPRPSVQPSPVATSAPSAAPAVTGTRLQIESDVPGAQVFVDRRFVGAAPVSTDVEPGRHRVNASAPGFDMQAEDLDVKPGAQTVRLEFKRVRLDETIDVEHSHAFGSCKGRLHATTEGLRYETDDEDDGFRAAFAQIERFEADYLKKTLVVKLRGGRKYEFKDAKDAADPLYAFHQRVEKVRTAVR